MTRVRHQVGIRGESSAVFHALTDPDRLAGWWPTSAAGACETGQTLELNFGGVVTLRFVVVELVRDRLLRLQCPDGPGPWEQSELSFALDPRDGQTFVTLVHQSDRASDDEFLYFNTKWPIYLLSLRDLIETGKGRPSPNDIPIFVGDTVTSNTQ